MKYSVDKNITLKDCIAEKLPQISKTKIKELIDRRVVFVNQKRVWISSFKLKRGDILELPDQPVQAKTEKLQIVYEDECLLIVNKPYGLISNGDKSVETILRNQYSNKAIEAVHRLDKDTSGLLMFAKNHAAFEEMKKVFIAKKIHKEYLAICAGGLDRREFSVNQQIDGQPATSHFKVLEQNNQAALLSVDIETGRKHQIRKHLVSIGHPVVGENLYNTSVINDPMLRSVARQMLHAWKLEFVHPYTQKQIQLKLAPPEDMQKKMTQLFQNYDLR